jgi:hypothetical protein
MSNSPARLLPTIWFYGAVAVSALLVAATALHILGPVSGPAASLLRRFSLTGENNPAAWWSGMLLAVVSLHAFDGHVLLRRREPGAATGWALIAAVLLFLSADEVSSIHERLGWLAPALGLGTWSLLLALGAVLTAVLGRALVLLWSAGGEQRRKVWPLAVGFLLLGSVALQEFLEHRIQWQTDAARAVRGAVEEGTELIGMLVLLGAAMANTAGLAVRGAAGGRPAFAALHELRRPLTTLGLALAPVLAVATAALVDQHRGHPADWLAAVAFLAAGLAACRHLFKSGGGIGWPTWGLGGLCCLASVAAVAVSAVKLAKLGPVEVSLRMLVLGLVSLLVCATWLSMSGSGKRAYLSGAVVLGVLAALSPLLSTTSPTLAYTLPQLLGLVTYWVNSMVMQQEIEEGPAVSQGLAVSARR